MDPSEDAPRLVISRSIGQLLVDYRRLEKIRQEALAEELGIRPATLSDWENDKSKPQSRFFPEIARRLGISTELVAATVRGYVPQASDAPVPMPSTPEEKELDIRLNLSRRLASDPPPSPAEIALMLELVRQAKADARQSADAGRPTAERGRRGRASAS